MKKILSYSGILLVTLTLTLGACKKKDDTTPSSSTTSGTTTKTGILSCKVDGKAWESDERSKQIKFADSMYNSIGAAINGDTFSLMAFKSVSGDTSAILMNALLSSNRTGTYNMSTTDYNIYYFSSIDPLAIFAVFFGYTAQSSLTISKFDTSNKKVSGTFNTTMTSSSGGPTITVTDGTFTDVIFDIQ